jgi:dCMP deaminase
MSTLQNALSSTAPLLNGVDSASISIPLHVESWDEYFLCLATVAAIKSKDPRCPVGAVIVSGDHLLLSTGFNGFARSVVDDEKSLDNPQEKFRLVCHAEQNAILNAARIGVPTMGTTIFVTKFPCLRCCNEIIQAGITRIYTHDDSFWDDDPDDKDHSRKQRVLHEAKIEVAAPYHSTFRPNRIIAPKKKPPVSVRS